MAVEISMPRLSDTMLQGTISYWYCREGDTIKEGEPFFVVETDKAAVDVEASSNGVVLKILVNEGESVPVGDLVAFVGEAGEDIESLLKTMSTLSKTTDDNGQTDHKKREYKKPKASPAAKKKARAENIDLSEITGTGEKGMITKTDIDLFLEQKGKTQLPDEISTEQERIVLTGIAKAMAEKMALTVDIPQVTTVAEVDATQLKQLSKQSSITITSFVAWAVALGLKSFPILNSSIDGGTVIIKKRFNIGISVATPNGLIVPNIKDAGNKNIYTLTESLAELVNKGRENRLTIDDITGGTFTITNSGVFGSLFFTPRINTPESAILGMGKIMEQPVTIEGKITVRSMMYLSLSYDHRVIDGENAVRFLQEVKKALETPGLAFGSILQIPNKIGKYNAPTQ